VICKPQRGGGVLLDQRDRQAGALIAISNVTRRCPSRYAFRKALARVIAGATRTTAKGR